MSTSAGTPKKRKRARTKAKKRFKDASMPSWKEYTMNLRESSGNFETLVAMSSDGDKRWTKDNIVAEASAHAQTSFKQPDSGERYTAWSNMNKMLCTKHNLVRHIRRGNKGSLYELTESGIEAAEILNRHLVQLRGTGSSVGILHMRAEEAEEEEEYTHHAAKVQRTATTIPPPSQHQPHNPQHAYMASHHPRALDDALLDSIPGWEVVLLLDNRERADHARLLDQYNVPKQVEQLSTGDLLWVARPKDSRTLKDAVVLDAIVERKRWDDLAQSITREGRMESQFHRMNLSGIERRFIIVEGKPADQRTLSLEVLQRYLCGMEVYGLPGGPYEKFEMFNQRCVKRKRNHASLTFAQCLMSVRNVSCHVAQAVVTLYPTARTLVQAYHLCVDVREEEQLLSKVQVDNGLGVLRNLGPVASKAIRTLMRTAH